MSHLKDENSLCLRNHLGNRLGSSDSSSSDSADDSEFEELFNLLKPPPIPAEIIRERSIYRAPSPEISEDHTSSSFDGVSTELDNKVETSGHYNNVKGSCNQGSCSDVNGFSEKEEEEMLFDDERVFACLDLACDLADEQYEIHNRFDQLSLSFLDALKEFSLHLASFGISVQNLKSEKSVISSQASLSEIAKLENNILTFEVLISTFYAYILSECFTVIWLSYELKKPKFTLIHISRQLIESLGNTEEIKERIRFRNLKSWDCLIKEIYTDYLIAPDLTNNQILKNLKTLFPKPRQRRRNRKKRARTENSRGNSNNAEYQYFNQEHHGSILKEIEPKIIEELEVADSQNASYQDEDIERKKNHSEASYFNIHQSTYSDSCIIDNDQELLLEDALKKPNPVLTDYKVPDLITQPEEYEENSVVSKYEYSWDNKSTSNVQLTEDEIVAATNDNNSENKEVKMSNDNCNPESRVDDEFEIDKLAIVRKPYVRKNDNCLRDSLIDEHWKEENTEEERNCCGFLNIFCFFRKK